MILLLHTTQHGEISQDSITQSPLMAAFLSYKWGGGKKPKNDSNASLNILLCSENGTVSVTVVEDIWLFLSDLRGLPLFLPNQMEHFDRYTIRHK